MLGNLLTNPVASYQFGIILGGILFTAFATQILDAFLDVIQTRVLSIARDEQRDPTADDIVSLATTQCIKHAGILLFAGGICASLEIHRWTPFVSPIVLLALFGRNIYLLCDAVLCLSTRSRLPRGLPKSVLPQ
jgi:hypothetical protein